MKIVNFHVDIKVLFSVLLLHLSGASADDTPVMTLNDVNGPPFTTKSHDGFLDLVANEAFRRIGYRLDLIKLPAERALLNVNAGIEDGELARIEGMDQTYPNMVRVEEKLIDWILPRSLKIRG